MSVQNPERVVTKQDLADFYGEILPYLGGMPEILANKFAKGDMYSADEKMIGQWIDGKPLYQKTFTGTIPDASSSTSAGTSYIDITNLNVDICVNCYGTDNGAGTKPSLPYIGVSAEYALLIWCEPSNSRIVVRNFNPSKNGSNAYVTLQYTKTTDSAVSIGNDTDYSTTEKIIGTWLDGKPLYQKTYGNLNVTLGNDWTDVVTLSDANITLINCSASSSVGTAVPATKINNGKVQAYMSGLSGLALSSITIQYTKTTD